MLNFITMAIFMVMLRDCRWVPDRVGPLDQEAFHRRAARSRNR